jgi:hypothetical protein
MLGGLDEVKEALDQAITVLTDLVEECDPALAPHLPEVLDRTLLQPFTAHRAAVEHRLATLAKRCSSPSAGPAAGLFSAACSQERLWEAFPEGEHPS